MQHSRRQGMDLPPHPGSHFTYRTPDGRLKLSVPVHGNKTLRPKTQRAIMRQAGFTNADL